MLCKYVKEYLKQPLLQEYLYQKALSISLNSISTHNYNISFKAIMFY